MARTKGSFAEARWRTALAVKAVHFMSFLGWGSEMISWLAVS